MASLTQSRNHRLFSEVSYSTGRVKLSSTGAFPDIGGTAVHFSKVLGRSLRFLFCRTDSDQEELDACLAT